jgi:hypothetical protein
LQGNVSGRRGQYSKRKSRMHCHCVIATQWICLFYTRLKIY